MEIVDIVGYMGTVTGTSFMVPQLYRTFKTKSVEDLSWAMICLLLVNSILWIIYGWLVPAGPILVANGVVLIISILLLILNVRYRNNP